MLNVLFVLGHAAGALGFGLGGHARLGVTRGGLATVVCSSAWGGL